MVTILLVSLLVTENAFFFDFYRLLCYIPEEVAPIDQLLF